MFGKYFVDRAALISATNSQLVHLNFVQHTPTQTHTQCAHVCIRKTVIDMHRKDLAGRSRAWRVSHSPYSHYIVYDISICNTYISKMVRESTSNCLFPAHRIVFVRLRFLIFLWVYPASGRCAIYHANYLFEYRLFCLPFLRSFCLSFFFPPLLIETSD